METSIEKGYQIYEEILELWEHEELDSDTGEPLFSPNSLAQIEQTKERLKKIENLEIEDEEFHELVANVRILINHDNVGNAIYNEIVNHWEYAEIDPKTNEEMFHPTSISQIEYSKTKLLEIDKLDLADEELIKRIENVKNIIEEAPKRKFSGSKWMMIVIGIFVAISVFANMGSFFKKAIGYYKKSDALRIYTYETERIDKQIKFYQGQPDTYKDKMKWLDEYQDKKIEHEKLTPEKYISKKNAYYRLRSIKNLWNAIFLLALYAGYFYASRAPIYLLNHRKKERELMRKSSSFVQKLIFGTLAAAWSTPITTYITKWSDGSETRDNDAMILLAFNVMLTVLVLMLVFYIMMVALPFLVIINYVRNYQIDKFQMVLDKVKAKFA